MIKLNLGDVEWKEFKIGELFTVEKGTYLPQSEIKEGNIPYITATTINNGVTRFIGNRPLFEGNTITIEKINFKSYYQSKPYYCSHDVTVISHKKINQHNGLFIANMISRQGEKYSYGKQAQMNVTKRESVYLPIDSQGKPNWSFMEEYMKQHEIKLLNNVVKYYENKVLSNLIITGSISETEWKEFNFSEVFTEIKRGKRLIKKNQIEGNIPYISSTGLNNGVDNFIGNKENVRVYEDCVTIANSGSVGSCFYHQYEFIASDHVTHLKNDKFDKYIYLFMIPIIKRLEEKYSFNREISDSRIQREKLILPVTEDGEIKFSFMRNFMKKVENDTLREIINLYKKRISNEVTRMSTLSSLLWKEFFITEIGEILSGKDIYERERNAGETPYITSTAQNNGVGYFVSNTNETLESNCISVNRNGSVGYSFYHPYKALFSNDTRKIRLEGKTYYQNLFISNQLSMQKEKYGYGYKMGTERLKRQKIMLPTKDKLSPDWDFMDRYMRELENSMIIRYLEFML